MALVRPNLTYRHDIDGLRALAVLAVIIFHGELGFLQGGYVGVDVFLVLSGYLITQRIIKGHQNGSFNYKQFFFRRVRRLFPAMIVTVIVTLICGTVFFGPVLLRELAGSAISSTLSVANVHFYLQSGYWDESAWTKPLLHMWSLGVEEQFYLVWPWIIVAILAVFRRSTLKVLIAITLISLLVTTLYTYRNPEATFYLTPFRTHEFAIGAICVWLDHRIWPKSKLGNAGQNLCFLAGLAAIVGPMFLFDETTLFPGWIAMVPAMGTALIILAKNPKGLGKLFANSWAGYIGMISYSLYLVHWPVLVFMRFQYGPFNAGTFAISLVIIVLLSILQYQLVENPFRHLPLKSGSDLKRILLVAGCSGLLVMAGSSSVIASNGFPNRYPEDLQDIAVLTKDEVQEQRWQANDQICERDKSGTICGKLNAEAANVLIVGDSHGVDGLNALSAAFPESNFLTAERRGCPLLTDLTDVEHTYTKCNEYNDRRFKDIDAISDNLDYVVFSQYLAQDRIKPMQESVNWFSARNVTPIVLGAGPEYDTELGVLDLILKHGSSDGLDEALNTHAHTEHYVVDDTLDPYVKALGGSYLSKRDFFCPDDVCQVLTESGMPLTFDTNHLTYEASQELGKYIAQKHSGLFKPQRS